MNLLCYLPENDPRTRLLEIAVGIEIDRIISTVKMDLSSLELSLLDVPALDHGHLGLYDIAEGKWMKIAAGRNRQIVSNPRLGFRLVDDSILGAVRHEFGHHLWYRKQAVQHQWNEFYREKGLGQWFRKTISIYAGANREEAWCECFSAFIAGLPIPEDLYEVIKAILASCEG